MKKKFTFFLDWDEGTYISQFISVSLDEAIKLWATKLDMSTIGACNTSKEKFLVEVECENAIAISGVESVWCISPTIEGRSAIVHIVDTCN